MAQRKDYTLKVRLAPDEQARAQRLADLTGGNVSDLVRMLIKDARVVVRPAVIEAEIVESQELVMA